MTLDQGLFVVHLRPITASIPGICSNYTLLSPPVNQPSSKFRTIIANSVDSPAIRNTVYPLKVFLCAENVQFYSLLFNIQHFFCS